MRLTIRELRKIIREQVGRNVEWSAGFFGGGAISGAPNRGTAPPGLGDEDSEIEKDNGKEDKEELTQAGPKAARRQRERDRASRSD